MQKIITVEIINILKDISEKNFSDIPNCCGAYVIKVQSKKLYVGSSKTLRSRILQHKVYNDPNFISENIISTCYYQTNNHVDARIIENWLIREIDPVLNKTNKSDVSNKNGGAKCSHDCKTWNLPGKNIKFSVHIAETCTNVIEKELSNLPNKPGVYVITTKSDEQYVGSATNVRSRVAEHNSLKGTNITESIKSVCCYITENRTDAYILEYAIIRELKPSLNKEFLLDAWKWKNTELNEHLKKTTPELRKLFEEFNKCVLSCIPQIKAVGRRDRITYPMIEKNKHVFFVKFMSGYLQVDLKDENNIIKDPTKFSSKIEPTQSDIFHRRFKLYNVSEIDNAIEIITQSYNEMKK